MTADFKLQTVPGDEQQRPVCQKCDYVRYDNPKIIVGAVTVYKGLYLMCRRANEPRVGKWTFPIGYMENGESPEEGAIRETYEEANAVVHIWKLLALFSVKRVNQLHMIFSAEMDRPDHSPGVESIETKLFDYKDIPMDELSFPNIKEALQIHRGRMGTRLPTDIIYRHLK